MDEARSRWLPDDEESVASRATAVRLLRAWAPFRLAGRLGRGAYVASLVAWHAACAIASGVVFAVVLVLASLVAGPEALNATVLPTLVLATAAYLVGLVGYAVRRLHDLDRSGAWAVLGFVPIVGLAFAAYLLFAPGTDGANAYGDAPPRAVAVRVGATGGTAIAAPTAAMEAHLEAAYDAGRRFAERRQGRE